MRNAGIVARALVDSEPGALLQIQDEGHRHILVLDGVTHLENVVIVRHLCCNIRTFESVGVQD
jgi:hypothetical protein